MRRGSMTDWPFYGPAKGAETSGSRGLTGAAKPRPDLTWRQKLQETKQSWPNDSRATLAGRGAPVEKALHREHERAVGGALADETIRTGVLGVQRQLFGGATGIENDFCSLGRVVAPELNQLGAVHRSQAHVEQDERRLLLPQRANEAKRTLQCYDTQARRLQRVFDRFSRKFAIVDDQDQRGKGSLIGHCCARVSPMG